LLKLIESWRFDLVLFVIYWFVFVVVVVIGYLVVVKMVVVGVYKIEFGGV